MPTTSRNAHSSLSPKVLLTALALGAAAVSPVAAQEAATPTAEVVQERRDAAEAEIRARVLDYIEGFLETDGQRVVNACHPMLSKLQVQHQLSGVEVTHLNPMTRDALGVICDTFNANGVYDAKTARRDITIHEIHDRIATVTLHAEGWYDFMHLAKVDGAWKIVNVLWNMLDGEGDIPEGNSDDEQLIKQACKTFVEGFYYGRPENVRATIHPQLAKYSIRGGRDGTPLLEPITYEALINHSKTWNATNWMDADTGRCDVEIFDHTHDSAVVKLTGEVWWDYLHMAKIDGKWVIAQCLWDSLGRPADEDMPVAEG